MLSVSLASVLQSERAQQKQKCFCVCVYVYVLCCVVLYVCMCCVVLCCVHACVRVCVPTVANQFATPPCFVSLSLSLSFANGRSGYLLKRSDGKRISSTKADIVEMCDHFNIQIDNPISILTQEVAKTFLTDNSPSGLFKVRACVRCVCTVMGVSSQHLVSLSCRFLVFSHTHTHTHTHTKHSVVRTAFGFSFSRKAHGWRSWSGSLLKSTNSWRAQRDT